MTFRELLQKMTKLAAENPDEEALDEHVVMRLQTDEDNGDELVCGGLRDVTLDAGCTDTLALVLDGDQEPDEESIDPRR